MSIFSKNKNFILSPMSGKVITLEELGDGAFSSGVLGMGVAIVPAAGKVYAPCDAVVDCLYPHAVSLISSRGAEILIHVGLDTVRLDGKGFTMKIKEGDKVKAGQLLLCCDLEFIRSQGLDTVTPMVVCNNDRFPAIKVVANNKVCAGDPVIILGDKR